MLQNASDFQQQHSGNSSCEGQIEWQNGLKYSGQIIHSQPSDKGKITIGGDKGILFGDNIFLMNSGKFGTFDKNTGQIKYKNYTIHIKTTDQFIQQHQTYKAYEGEIRWPNGNYFQGKIQQDKPYDSGTFFASEKGIFESGVVYFNQSGKLGKLDADNGDIIFENYTIVSYSQDDRFGDQGTGVITWQNGVQFSGSIRKGHPSAGDLVDQYGTSFKYCDSHLYNTSSCKLLWFDMNGEPYSISYYVKYSNDFLFAQQSDHGVFGRISYVSGIKFVGLIQSYYRAGGGKLITSNGRNLVGYGDEYVSISQHTVYFLGFNQQYQLNLLKPKISCSNRLNYIQQLQKNMDVNGRIVWPNGCQFIGKIHNSYPLGSGQFIYSNGEEGILLDDNIHLLRSGKFGWIDPKKGEVHFCLKTVHFANLQDYIRQYSEQTCAGVITWPCGTKYEGTIYQNDMCCGKLFHKDQQIAKIYRRIKQK